ncbi:MAG TPA: GIY-YIG nuclease family protein [Rhizobiaceae bacterium]|nr:GIY-YIG nuclease family protein [Rhizobiaceae bacterium]
MSGWVYIMASQPNGTLYVGVTSDLENRIFDHKNDRTPGFASKYGCKTLVWYERHPNIVLAIQRERSLKEYRRAWKLNLINGFNPDWVDLTETIHLRDNPYRPHPNTRMYSDYT